MTMYRNPDIEPAILERMGHHTHVLIASSWFTNRRILEKADKMQSRIIVSHKHENAPAHWHVVRRPDGSMMHYKFMVLGDENEWKEVIYGSYNFTENANRNDEVIKVSTDKDDITHMVESFEALWPSKPLVSKINPWAAPSRPKPTPAQADDKLWLKLGSKPKSTPGSAPIHKLSLKRVVIAQHSPWDFIWEHGKNLTSSWEGTPIVSDLINMLFKYVGRFDIRNECTSEWGDMPIGGGVCLIEVKDHRYPSREILVVKDDNNGTTYTISNWSLPTTDEIRPYGENYTPDDMTTIKHIKVWVAKDEDRFVDYVWVEPDTGLTTDFLRCANHEEVLCSSSSSFEYNQAYNHAGLWSVGMDVGTEWGSIGCYVDSIVEICSAFGAEDILDHLINAYGLSWDEDDEAEINELTR